MSLIAQRSPYEAYQYITYPVMWVLSQAFFIFPTLILLGLILFPRRGAAANAQVPIDAFTRRYVTMLAFGPFAIVTIIGLVSGRAPIATWGYPLWLFLPLAASGLVRAGGGPATQTTVCRRVYFSVPAGACRLDRGLVCRASCAGRVRKPRNFPDRRWPIT